MCQNYVTEKFWNIKRLIVPVVLTRQVFAGMNVPDDAYIAADEFNSAEALAEHLKMLAANKQYYLKYANQPINQSDNSVCSTHSFVNGFYVADISNGLGDSRRVRIEGNA